MNDDPANTTPPTPPATPEFRPVEMYVMPQAPVSSEPFCVEIGSAPQPVLPYAEPKRRVALPVLLFFATCLSTFWAGLGYGPFVSNPEDLVKWLADLPNLFAQNWGDGLLYMGAVMSILLAHEMGHFLQARRYRIPASLPFFIPMPLTLIGTMGAVIGMQGSKADRKQLFDIGVSGPLAGLAVAIPIAWVGVLTLQPVDHVPSLQFELPLILQGFVHYLHPEPGNFRMNALTMAGWVGMLITGLNMLPISQLDGGHVAYSLLGRRAHLLARGMVVAAVAFIILSRQYNWMVMLALVVFIGADHPPTANDRAPLGMTRRIIGWLSLAIPILCFVPIPVRV